MVRAKSCGSTADVSIDSVSLLTPGLLSLPDSSPGDGARDHQPLELRGAIEDRVDLGVALHPLHGILARVSVAAEDLDRPLGGPDGDLAGLQLRHRALGGVEVLSGPAHPGCPPDEQARGVDL